MSQRSSFDSSSDSDSDDEMALANFALLGGPSTRSQQEIIISPIVLNILFTCSNIDHFVKIALSNLNSKAEASDNPDEKVTLNQTLGILLVIGRGLQGALEVFAKHVVHRCNEIGDASDDVNRMIRQFREWVTKSPVLATNDDVKIIQGSFKRLVSESAAYQREQTAKPSPVKPTYSTATITEILNGSISAGLAQSYYNFRGALILRQLANEQLAAQQRDTAAASFADATTEPPSSPSFSRSSSSSSLGSAGSLFATLDSEREAAQHASPSLPPSSPRSSLFKSL